MEKGTGEAGRHPQGVSPLSGFRDFRTSSSRGGSVAASPTPLGEKLDPCCKTSGDLSLGADKVNPATGEKDGPGVARKPGVSVVPPDAPVHDGGLKPRIRRQTMKLEPRERGSICSLGQDSTQDGRLGSPDNKESSKGVT